LGGSEARSKAAIVTADEVREIMSKYAACVIKNRRRGVEAYLASPPDSSENDRLFGEIQDDNCLASGELTIVDGDFRGAAYGELYRMDYGRGGDADLSAKAKIDYTRGRDVQAPVARAHVALRQFADCVVRAAPGQSRKLILSRIGTNEERAAFASLGPHLGPCVFAGDKVSFSKGPLRAVLGEVLYLLSRAPAAAPEPAART
jgi:hypothetical protein